MMPKTVLAIATFAVLSFMNTSNAQTYGGPMGPGMGPGMMGSYGYGPMGPGYRQGYGHGYGPMRQGYGMGPGMIGGYGPGHMMGQGYGMGPGMPWGGGLQRWADVNHNLSVDDVKRNLERWLAFQGNDRLKLGEVTQKDDSTIEATIVTKKESAIVQKFAIDKRTGFTRPVGG